MLLDKEVNFKDFSRPNKEIKYFSRILTELKDFSRQRLKFKTFSKILQTMSIIRIHASGAQARKQTCQNPGQ